MSGEEERSLEAIPPCEVCEGAADLKRSLFNVKSFSDMARAHGYCKNMLSSEISAIEAAGKLKHLQLPGVKEAYSLVTIVINETEENDVILSQVVSKLKEEMRNSEGLAKGILEQFNRISQELNIINEKKTKEIICYMFFYDCQKFIQWTGGYEADPEYQDACRIVYYALGLKHANTLKNQCIRVLRELETDYASEAVANSPKYWSSVPEGKNVTNDGTRAGQAAIPKELAEELMGILYFHGYGVCTPPYDELTSDDIVIAINRPCGMAVGVYAWYDHYCGSNFRYKTLKCHFPL